MNPNQNSQFYVPNLNLGLLHYELWALTTWPLISIAQFYGKQPSQEPNNVRLDCSVKILCDSCHAPLLSSYQFTIWKVAYIRQFLILQFSRILLLSPSYTPDLMHHHPEHSKTIFCSQTVYFSHDSHTPVPVATRSKAWLCSHSLVEIAGSNLAKSMDACLLWVLGDVR
jgi:hypothetical protein